jgi:hypothetical protein
MDQRIGGVTDYRIDPTTGRIQLRMIPTEAEMLALCKFESAYVPDRGFKEKLDCQGFWRNSQSDTDQLMEVWRNRTYQS